MTSTNPVERLDFITSKRREVEILELDEIARLLNDALDNDLPLLPFLVLGFFCEIRPEGELLKLEWRDIDWRGREVTTLNLVGHGNVGFVETGAGQDQPWYRNTGVHFRTGSS